MDPGRPFVILNAAMTADGKTDTISREGAGISSIEDADRVDRLRAGVDAILVGGKTLLENDPRLTVKSDVLRQERIARGLLPNPVKVGVVTRATIQLESRFMTYGPAMVMVFTTSQTKPNQLDRLIAQGVKVFIAGEKWVDLVEVMRRLWQEGIRRVLVEGGGTINEQLLRLRLVDEIYIYQAPLIFGGREAPTFVDGEGFDKENALWLQLLDCKKLADGGVLLHYSPIYK